MALGGGVLSVGFLNGMDNLLSALYSFPGGYLSDRLGYKRALLVFNLIAMAGYLVVILVPAWWAVILGAALFLSWTRHLAAGHDEPGGGGAAQAEAHHGRLDALAGAAHPHGAGAAGGRGDDRLAGRGGAACAGRSWWRWCWRLWRWCCSRSIVEERKPAAKAEANPLRLFGLMTPPCARCWFRIS